MFNNTGGVLTREEEGIGIQIASSAGITGKLEAVFDNGFVLDYVPGKAQDWDSRHDDFMNRFVKMI